MARIARAALCNTGPASANWAGTAANPLSLFLCLMALGLATAIAAAASGVASSPWPLSRHDVARTGLSQFDTSANIGTPEWAFTTGSFVFSSPAIAADGTIYVGSVDRNLYAVNPGGSQKWKFTTGAPIVSSPAIGADGTIYIGSEDNNLYAVNADGTQKWKFATGNAVFSSSPAIAGDGTIYVGSYDHKLYAVNPDGTQKWKFTTGDRVLSSPAIGADGTVYIGSNDANLYAVNPDGTQKWKFTTGSHLFSSSPAIGADGTVYVGSGDGNLYAVNSGGTQNWKFTTAGRVSSSPGIAADGTIYVGSGDGNLYAVNPDGTQKWKFATGFGVSSSPAIGADGTIYVGSDDDSFYAVHPDGTQKWKFATGSFVDSSPAIGADGTVYVGSVDANLYALGPGAFPAPTPVPVELKVVPSKINLGIMAFAVDSGAGQQSGVEKITVMNPGGKHGLPVTFGQVLTSSSDFAIHSNTCTGSLQPGKKCVVTLSFIPSTVGAESDQLIVNDNATPQPQVVPLSGKGVAPVLKLNTRSISFGRVAIGKKSPDKKVILKNLNRFVPITIESDPIRPTGAADFSGDFAIDADSCGSTPPLAPGKACTISISFSPKSGGPETAELDIFDDASGGRQVVKLTGTGH